MQILTMPGCPRARNVKQLLKEYGIPAAERGLYQVLCDAQKYRPLIEEMAAHYGCTPQELIESPSRISRPFLVVSPAEQSSRQDFFQALKERDFYPNCTRKCPKRAVCPASKNAIDCLSVTGFKKSGQKQ